MVLSLYIFSSKALTYTALVSLKISKFTSSSRCSGLRERNLKHAHSNSNSSTFSLCGKNKLEAD